MMAGEFGRPLFAYDPKGLAKRLYSLALPFTVILGRIRSLETRHDQNTDVATYLRFSFRRQRTV